MSIKDPIIASCLDVISAMCMQAVECDIRIRGVIDEIIKSFLIYGFCPVTVWDCEKDRPVNTRHIPIAPDRHTLIVKPAHCMDIVMEINNATEKRALFSLASGSGALYSRLVDHNIDTRVFVAPHTYPDIPHRTGTQDSSVNVVCNSKVSKCIELHFDLALRNKLITDAMAINVCRSIIMRPPNISKQISDLTEANSSFLSKAMAGIVDENDYTELYRIDEEEQQHDEEPDIERRLVAISKVISNIQHSIGSEKTKQVSTNDREVADSLRAASTTYDKIMKQLSVNMSAKASKTQVAYADGEFVTSAPPIDIKAFPVDGEQSGEALSRIMGVPYSLVSSRGGTSTSGINVTARANVGIPSVMSSHIASLLSSLQTLIDNTLPGLISINYEKAKATPLITVEMLPSILQMGIVTRNEARHIVGLKRVEGGDELVEPPPTKKAKPAPDTL